MILLDDSECAKCSAVYNNSSTTIKSVSRKSVSYLSCVYLDKSVTDSFAKFHEIANRFLQPIRSKHSVARKFWRNTRQ